MSPSTPTNEPDVISTTGPSLQRLLKASAFWAAVLLPVCSVIVIASGLTTPQDYLALGGFVLANVVALVLGHDYRQ